MRYILTGEGKIEHNAGTFAYQYFHKDHLGNTRVTYKQNGEIVQTADYYPFGLRHEPMALEDASQKYLYNGKELQPELEWYDYGARMYDAAIARWNVIDPEAERYKSIGPYSYVANNPIKYIDIKGRKIGNPNGADAQRMKTFLNKTETGAALWNSMVSSERTIYIHYASGDGDKTDSNIPPQLGVCDHE